VSRVCRHCGTAFEPARRKQRCCGRKCYMAAYYSAHRDSIAKRKAAYYAANRDRLVKRQAIYFAANRERYTAYYAANREKYAAYYAANRDRIRKRQAAYREANRERYAAYYAANRDKIRKRQAAYREAKRLSRAKIKRHQRTMRVSLGAGARLAASRSGIDEGEGDAKGTG
jgi:hypothetical protein